MFGTSEKIVHTYTKKYSTPDVPEDITRETIRTITEGYVVMGGSFFNGIQRYIMGLWSQESKEVEDVLNAGMIYKSERSSQKVFSHNRELMLVDYITNYSKINYSITYQQIYKLAYVCASKLDCEFPNGLRTDLQSLTGYKVL